MPRITYVERTFMASSLTIIDLADEICREYDAEYVTRLARRWIARESGRRGVTTP